MLVTRKRILLFTLAVYMFHAILFTIFNYITG